MTQGRGRVRYRAVLIAAAVAVLLAMWAPAAHAALIFQLEWGQQGSAPEQFEGPEGIGTGIAGDVYVADTGNDRVQRFDSDGLLLNSWGSFGTANGRFNRPGGIAVDFAGNVYVADMGNHRVQKFSQTGAFLAKFGTFGTGNGQFVQPYGVAVDGTGNVFVTDTGNNRVQKFDASGTFVTKWGTTGSATGSFDSPVGIALDLPGNVYVADASNNRIQKFDGNGAFLDTWGTPGSGPGELSTPYGLAVSSGASVQVADSGNHRIQTFTTNGGFVTETGGFGSSPGQFKSPSGIALDADERVYVADTFNHRVQRFSASGSGIVIRKDAVPNDPQDFDFTTGGGLSPASFQLDDDGSSANGLTNVRTFVVSPGSGYSVAEGPAPPGWDQASATCSDGSPVSNIDVSADEVVSCTFTNHKRGRIVVVQEAQPSDDPQDFDFTTGGGLSPASFTLDDDGDNSNELSDTQVIDDVLPGSGYSVTQDTPAGWGAPDISCSDGSSATNIDVGPGETVTCTFSNLSPDVGQIKVVKDTQPDNIQVFTFSATGMSPTPFFLDDDGNNSNTHSNTRSFIVSPGDGFAVSEQQTNGWVQSSATCSDGSPLSNIDVSAGETVTCTFTNVRAGAINVIKDAQPNDPQDFDFTAGGGLSPTSFQLDDDPFSPLARNRAFNSLLPGSGYSVMETVPPGWEQLSATCSDGSPPTNITLSAGEVVACIFTNRKLARVIVNKDTQPDDPQDFDFTTGGGLSPASFQLDDDGNDGNELSSTRTISDIAPGSGYSITESPVAGWSHSPPTCSDGSPAANLDLEAGETVTCNFTNRKHGEITVVQDTQPDDPQDFSFTTGGGLGPASFQLDDDGDDQNGLAHTTVLTGVVPGDGYSITQAGTPGWLLEDATCSDGSPVSDIDVAPDESITCTFVNTQRSRIVVRKDADPDDGQDFDFTAGGGLSPASFQLDDDGIETNALASTQEFLVEPGAGYSVAEAPPPAPDWTLESADCDDGSPISNIDVVAGETVTCTFVNAGRIHYPRPKGATPVRASLVVAQQPCNTPNRTHGPPLAHPSCHPTVQPSTAVTVGTPDNNGAAANFEGHVRYDVLFFPGGVDDTDVRFRASITDLRCKAGTVACANANAADGADYVGEVTAQATVRITDQLQGGNQSGTVVDVPLPVTFGCAISPSTSVGGACAIDTTLDAVTPGIVPEGKRSIWQMGPVQVFDGGADGQMSTTPNFLLLAQGILVP